MGVDEQAATASIRAAYGLALRMTGSPAAAGEAVVRAVRVGGLEPAPLVQAVRAEARQLPGRPQRVAVSRPDAFHGVALRDWEVVERIALRGMTISEAAEDAGLSRAETIMRLQRGMRAARACLERGQATADTETPAAHALGGDRATRRLDDPARDRQAETAPLSRLPA